MIPKEGTIVGEGCMLKTWEDERLHLQVSWPSLPLSFVLPTQPLPVSKGCMWNKGLKRGAQEIMPGRLLQTTFDNVKIIGNKTKKFCSFFEQRSKCVLTGHNNIFVCRYCGEQALTYFF